MKIVFTTNLDAYKSSHFPTLHHFVPRVGEMVEVKKQVRTLFVDKKLPRRLEVVNVTHQEESVLVELWYNETDKKLAIAAGAKPLG